MWLVRKDLDAEFGVNNVSDENYVYEEGFPEPGRTYFMNANFRFERGYGGDQNSIPLRS